MAGRPARGPSSAALPSASLVENARFNALVIVPSALQGLFRRRRAAVAAATKAGVDRWAVGLLSGMRRNHGPGPVWVRVLKDRALLVLSVDDVRRVLGSSPDPFAADPPGKRNGMVAFQPDALTLSRGELWRNRRRFTEAVLDTGRPLHRLADRFAAVARAEGEALLAELDREALGWEAWHRSFRRMTRRVVLGDAAREDEQLSELLGELMSEANGLPGKPSERLAPFMERVAQYVGAAEQGSLVSLFGQAPSDAHTKTEGQLPHWLFATQDTLAINTLRCLALLGAHEPQRVRVEAELADSDRDHGIDSGAGIAALSYLEACLEEAMRLWPTTPMLSRETVSDVDWNGATVPAGTQIVISNTFLHRDRDRHQFADRFAPEAWIEGSAADDWSFNHLSHGPQACPGSDIALFLGKALLASVLTSRRPNLVDGQLDPGRPLPHMLDFFALRLRLEPR